MDRRGMTLLELILALSMVTGILFAVTTVSLSSARTSLNASLDIKMEEELTSVFREMELYLTDGISNGILTQKPEKTTGTFPANTAGPLVYRGTDSRIWLGVLNNNTQQVWYGYKPSTHELIRRIYSTTGAVWSADVPLSAGTASSPGILGPYSLNGPDVNGDKTVTPAETTAFNTCMADLSAASCENQNPPIYPVFQVTKPDLKIIYISFQSEGTVAQRVGMMPGMTKTIFLHTSAS